jgi:cytochrome P450
MARVRQNRTLLDSAFDESMRWISPVQSATRHCVKAHQVAGVTIPAGATVNCMIASANRDEAMFASPDIFDVDRPNIRKHMGFATGPHLCLGRHLAREECLAVVNQLFDRTQNLRLAAPLAPPAGHEFRQPPSLWLEWDVR